jgi:hypothetical protein
MTAHGIYLLIDGLLMLTARTIYHLRKIGKKIRPEDPPAREAAMNWPLLFDARDGVVPNSP